MSLYKNKKVTSFIFIATVVHRKVNEHTGPSRSHNPFFFTKLTTKSLKTLLSSFAHPKKPSANSKQEKVMVSYMTITMLPPNEL